MSAAPLHFRDSYLPALQRRGALIPATAEALNREGRRLRERGGDFGAIAKHQEALRLKGADAATQKGVRRERRSAGLAELRQLGRKLVRAADEETAKIATTTAALMI